MEQQIKAAIAHLSHSETGNREQLQIIATALANSNLGTDDWNVIFNEQGAEGTMLQIIYTPEMVRILTLRAIILPSTLSQFLLWMSLRTEGERYLVSQLFQATLLKPLTEIGEYGRLIIMKLYKGVLLIVPTLIEQPQLLPVVIWLLSSKAGLWAFFYRQLRQDIDSDLSLMSRKVEGENNLPFKLMNAPQWQAILMNVEGFWVDHAYPNQPQYQPLAALFESLGDYKIAAFFHHVVSGEVPKKVFTELSQKGFQWEIYQIWVTREVNTREKIWLLSMELGARIAPTRVAIGMIVFSLAVGGVLGIYRQKYLYSPTTTEQGITAMRNYFGATFPEEENKKVNQAILAVFRSASGNAKLQEKQITQEQEAGVLAIKAYQDKLSQFNPELSLKYGIIESGGNTYKFLTCDVADKLLLQLENRPTICRQLNQNTTSIKQLISDLVRELNADGKDVQQGIVNILRVYSEDLQLSLKDITQESDRGKEAVKAYQQIKVVGYTGSSVDGIISNRQNTFKILKCHVADIMEIPLPNRPPICDSARL